MKYVGASIASVDTLYVSTIGGHAFSDGITISSSIYMASGSSLTLQGASGYLATSSSVSAAAYFGDGSHLAGVAIINATQTFGGANTFASSFVVQSGGLQIILSTSSSVNNISISTIGAITFFPELHNSSDTIIPSGGSTTNTNFGPCLAGSTITITTTGGRVEVLFTGDLLNETDGAVAAANFLQDGNFVNNLSSTTGIVWGQEESNWARDIGPFRYLLDAPSPGIHSYCLTLAAPNGGGATQLDYSDGSGALAVTYTNLFYVKEIK